MNNMSVGADEAPKLKLSEIIAAMDADRIELDCKAVLAVCSSTQSVAMLNVSMLDVTRRTDSVLLLIHAGISHLMHEAMNFREEALAALAAAMGRAETLRGIQGAIEELRKDRAGKGVDPE